MTRLDPLLEQIDRTLAECDARHLPPLTSSAAAAALDLAEQAGPQLTPWQRSVVVSMNATPLARPARLRLLDRARRWFR